MKGKPIFSASIAVLLVAFLLLPLMAAGCQSETQTKDAIKIGFSRSLTGWSAAGGQDEQEAVILWSEQVNEDGGIYVEEYGEKLSVELVFYDDKSDPEEVIKIYERLINVDKVDVLFPPTMTPQNIATIAIAEKYHMPILAATCGSSRGQELGAKYWWAITPIGSSWMDRGNGLAGLINAHKDGIRDVAIIYIHDQFSIECHEALVGHLNDLGFNIVLDKDYPVDVKDLSDLLLEAKSKNVDAFIALAYPPDGFMIGQQSIVIDFNPKFMYLFIAPATNAFYPIFGPASEGVCSMGMYCGALDYPGAKEFYDSFVERWGHAPNLLQGADGFHAAQLMQQAIERAGTLDPEKIREVLATQEFMTIHGPVRLRDGINEVAVPGVLQWQDGEAQTVWPPQKATADLLFPKPSWP